MLKGVSLGKFLRNRGMSVLMAEHCKWQKMAITAGTPKEAVLSAQSPAVRKRPFITHFTPTPPKLAPPMPVAAMTTPSTWEKCKRISPHNPGSAAQ